MGAQASAVTVAAVYTLNHLGRPQWLHQPRPGLHGYARGSSATVTATPAAGYSMESWGGDCGAMRAERAR